MKSLFLVVFSLFMIVTHCGAQISTKDGDAFYEYTDTVTATKSELYTKAKNWFVNTFKDAKEVIQIDEKEAGQIIGKGNLVFYYTYLMQAQKVRCNFTTRVDLKDNKYRIQLYNFDLSELEATMPLKKLIEDPTRALSRRVLPKIDEESKAIIESFKKAMKESLDSNF